MAKQRIELDRLGSAVAQVLDRRSSLRQRALERARVSFLSRSAPTQSSRFWDYQGRRGAWLLAPVAVLALVLLGFGWTRSAATPLSFRVDGNHGDVDAWLAAPPHQSVFVDFSDGTGLRIEESSRARVTGVGPHGAKVSLESGALHAEVTHSRKSEWTFSAGPLAVRVIGTKFDLHWEASREQFSITVIEGAVGVSGAIAGTERPVRAGETLSISLRDRHLELTNTTPAIESSPSLAPIAAATATTVATSQVAYEGSNQGGSTSNAKDVASTIRTARWRELASRGQLREAYAAVEAIGFPETCQSASSSELLLLGDAARLAGRPDRANLALLALRQRYPTDGRRAAAAFSLGKIAFDQLHSYAVAASWFSKCLSEQPAGGFAREAAGRLIEANRAAGNAAAAESAARSYLVRYPSGPHADLAKSLLH